MRTANAEFPVRKGAFQPMTERQTVIRDNLLRVFEKMAEAEKRRGSEGKVTLLGATKTVSAEDVVFAGELGLRVAGENRVQEFTDKFDAVSAAVDEYHFIGHLQTNKVKYLVGRCPLIHSASSMHLIAEIDRLAEKRAVTQDVLLEVNCAGEDTKSGFSPEAVAEAVAEAESFKSIRVRGLMTMGPAGAEKEVLRKFFRETYSIFIDIFEKKPHNIREYILSMGMSDSYELAIEEGATLVRVGSAIFGNRLYT